MGAPSCRGCARCSSCMWHSRAEKLHRSACRALRSHIHPTGWIWDASSGSPLYKEVWSSGTPHTSHAWPQPLPLGQGCQVYLGCVSLNQGLCRELEGQVGWSPGAALPFVLISVCNLLTAHGAETSLLHTITQMFPVWGCDLGCCPLPVPWGGPGFFAATTSPVGAASAGRGWGAPGAPLPSLLSCKVCFWGLSPSPGVCFWCSLPVPPSCMPQSLGWELGAAGACGRMGRRCRIRETSSSCCAASPRSISVPNLLLLEAIIIIIKNLQKIFQPVSLCAGSELCLVNRGLFA